MQLSTKHNNQQTVVRADFSGGLNTSANVDGIAENQLADAVNVELDHATGRLKTVAGTRDLINFEKEIFAAMYDDINKVVLIAASDKNVFAINLETGNLSPVGTLTGELYPVTASWEDGVLIATGGKLQYFNGQNLSTIDSPIANDVYIRAGRVIVTEGSNVRYSGVGDETNWTEDTGDASTSKFVEVGYKDGGKFIGMVNLSSDILIIKNNRRVYRLYGEYPEWSIAEVSRNIECSGRLSFCAVADSVFVLGKNEVQVIQTTQNYGDVKPQNVASTVTSEIQKMPPNALVRYVPPLGQIWCIGSNGVVMTYDTTFNSWFKRQFNGRIIDVISIGDEVFVIKPHGIAKLDENIFYDSGIPLQWKFQTQRLVSQHEYLLKRLQISIVPLSTLLYTGQISAGAVIVGLPVPSNNIKIWHNRSPIYKNHVKVGQAARRKSVYTKGDRIFDNLAPIYQNRQKIFSRRTIIKESRNVYRSKFLDIKGRGSSGGFLLNGIILDIAEV